MNSDELLVYYKKRKKEIKNRLKEFSKVKGNDIFYELCFCLLTPQSNAFKCNECVHILKNKNFIKKQLDIKPILRDKTRFYKNKSNYLIYNKNNYDYIKKAIINKNKNNIKKNREIREQLVKDVKGLGYKEASHFLRNIGYRNLAILDRHILKNLQKLKIIDMSEIILSNKIHKSTITSKTKKGMISEHFKNQKIFNEIPKNLSKKNYLLIENKLYKFSKKINIPMDELDLLLWSIETGRVFK